MSHDAALGTFRARKAPTSAGDVQASPSSVVLLSTVAVLIYLTAVVRIAWTSDDSFVTFRAVDNWIHGYGLRSNPAERVLGFTNPLWGFLLAVPMALGASPYSAAIGTAFVCSAAAALYLARRGAGTPLAGGIAVLWLALSSAYTDYSTSGLENPLAHLLCVVFFSEYLRRDERWGASVAPWLLGSMIALNRLDHAILVLPALASFFFAPRDTTASRWVSRVRPRLARPLRRLLGRAALGALPLFAWLAFAVVYYGFPYPNTAYAKLTTSIPGGLLVAQGAWYLVDAVKRDPLTPFVIALALTTMARDRSRHALGVGAGLALYLVYILRVGGDFMAGRFLTTPFVISTAWLAARWMPRAAPAELLGVGALTGAMGIWFCTAFLPTERFECFVVPSGIVNERRCYAEYTGLSENVRTMKYKTHDYYKIGLDAKRDGKPVLEGLPGMTGFAAGPRVHVVDPFALTDPLLARIPYKASGADFRVGHFSRPIPPGYMQTVMTGVNVIEDPCLHRYYDLLMPVLRGPLFTAERWKSIVGLNFGKYDYLLRPGCTLRAGL